MVRLFIRTPTGRRRLNVLGALDFVTRELVTVTNTTHITAQTACELLETLAGRDPGQAITLVLDNARYQRCRWVQDRAVGLGIELMYLPSYWPHLNLIERIWGLLKKRCLNGQYDETFDLFQRAIHDGIAKLATDDKPNVQTLITRNFQHFNNRTILAA